MTPSGVLHNTLFQVMTEHLMGTERQKTFIFKEDERTK